jgi:ACS family tartrate transporter-like MFS transporter
MGWQWLFILQGLPAALLGIVALLFLDDHPEQAKWLSKDERHALAATLAAEAKATRKAGFDDIKHALTEPRVLVLGLTCFCGAVGLYGLGFWLPQVLKTFGLSSLAIGFLTAIPYLVASTGMVLWSWHSDATSERAWHIALPLLLAAAAFVGLRLEADSSSP